MRIIIDIGHPAHVHLFRNFAKEMGENGHQIFFTCREKEFEIELLSYYGFNYKSFGKKFKSIPGKLLGLIIFVLREFIVSIKFKPDLFLSHGSTYAALASFLYRKPHISLEDTFNMEQVRLYLPFTEVILTGDYLHPNLGKKECIYKGYHELAYLHPFRFQPDKDIFKFLGINENEKYMIIRFVSWQATHDLGHSGISEEKKMWMVDTFNKHLKVFISSESKLPLHLEKYRIKLHPSKIHDAIAHASLLFGESSTMAEEAAMLGVPSIFINNSNTYYTEHLEGKYGLLFNFKEIDTDLIQAVNKGLELISDKNIGQIWQNRRKQMLDEKIDVTAFLVWFVENYPASFKTMKENPDYQLNFK